MLGNDYDGVYIKGSSNNTIGGANPGEGNLIRFNDEAGVYVYSGTGNAIRGNAIDGNSDGGATALGIDLRNLGVTANDTGDADTGANKRQNFPVLTASEASPAATSVTGTLNSTANSSGILIDFYASPACDPSGNGEGAIYLGSTTVNTDGSGNATISVSTLDGLPDDDALQITATATDAQGNTSEFSACVTASYTPGEPSGWDGTGDWHYEYDGLDRLTYACDAWNGASCDGSEWTYSYDGAGNLPRFDKWDGAEIETVAYVYNGANQIQCVDGNANGQCGDAQDVGYLYDDYGNLTFDGVTTYEYDAAMRLTSASAAGSTTSYTYNGDGDRISQTVDSVTTTYTLDVATPLTMVLAEQTGTDDSIYYLHSLGLVAQAQGENVEYFNVDGLGSVRQLTDESGDVLLAQSFDPYGSPYQSVGAEVTAYGWAGEQADANGLIYLRARFYAPGMGRFLNTDPSRQEMNPYWYSYSNPLNYTDPSGLCARGYSREQETGRCVSWVSLPFRAQNGRFHFWDFVDVDRFLVSCYEPEGSEPHPYFDSENAWHYGVDWAAGNASGVREDQFGRANIYAVLSGKVVARNDNANVNDIYGFSLIVETRPEHLSQAFTMTGLVSPGNSVFTLYAHLADAPAPRVDDQVISGLTIIGIQGASGAGAGGRAHLHFETRVAPVGAIDRLFGTVRSFGSKGNISEQRNMENWWGRDGEGGSFVPKDPLLLLGWSSAN